MLAADFFAVPDQVTVGEVADTGRVRRDLTEKYGFASGVPGLLEKLSRGPVPGSASVGSMQPAGSSKRICLVPWRYWRTKTKSPSTVTATTTQNPAHHLHKTERSSCHPAVRSHRREDRSSGPLRSSWIRCRSTV